ncbi:MAG: BtpA/SgcQ family protein [Anaerolineae bacterium]|nr:BtpA/SgcQ family protein [Anaerolineae bacterium]
MRVFETLGKKKTILGMVHLGALPGTPFEEDYAAVREKAIADAKALEAGGADGCVVQNRGDQTFPVEHADPTVVAAMADIVRAIDQVTGPDFQVGLQVLRNDLRAAIAIARVCNASFLRMGVFTGVTASSQGLVSGYPYEFMKYRKAIGATHVKLISEIYSMHFKFLGGEKTAVEVANDAKFNGAHAVAICDPDTEMIVKMTHDIKKSTGMPVIISGYTDHKNVDVLLKEADGAIVGGAFEGGARGGWVQVDLVRDYMERVRKL